MNHEQAKNNLHSLLKVMLTKKASDLFISYDFPPSMKIDGKMTPVTAQKLTPAHTKALAHAAMNEKQRAEFEAEEESNFAMIDYRNENSYGHIITIEDPVEYVHKNKNCLITHREVGTDTVTWHAALKNTLRQAPDVILIGEIRDRETMEHAIAFAETGHLCMATLHANSANQALDRIINFFPEERRAQLLMDLSLNLTAGVQQRLISRSDGQGRRAAIEILLNSPFVSDLIFKGEVHAIKELMAKSREMGMQTFDQALFDLYEAGEGSYEDALRNADSLSELKLTIKLHSKRARAA